jgi:2'-5' RNA ligase
MWRRRETATKVMSSTRSYTAAMQAIVSALDDPHREMVENIWGELKAVFGLQGVIGSTRPHFTYHVAQAYDAASIDAVLTGIARAATPFAIDTHGLGVFRGDETVLYLHISPSPALAGMHRRVWDAAAPIATDPKPVYAAATWVPHITLAIGDLTEDVLPLALQFLNRREYHWTIPVTNLCLIDDTSSASAAWRRFELGGDG